MICCVCGLVSADLVGNVDGTPIYFHTNCAACYICGKPALQFTVMEDHELIFMHETCVFTPEEGASLLRMQAEYRTSHLH